MTIENSYFGELNRESIYSDSMNLYFINNQVGLFKTTGISGSNKVFNFSLNTIETIETYAISVAFLTGEMSRSVAGVAVIILFSFTQYFSNTFVSLSGTPLRDIGPEPVCMPESDNTYYSGN